MDTLITVVHVFVCLFLVIVVLLQAGKGAEIGAVMGGAGSQALFGGSGSGNFLSKLTVWAAAVFMLTSIGLTILGRSGTSRSVMDSFPDATPPAVEFNAAATEPTAAETAPAELTSTTLGE